MWPFSKKIAYPGVKENSDGTIEFTLTEEESSEADLALKAFSGYVVHPDAGERLSNGTIAVALSRYAKDLVANNCVDITDAELKSNWSSIREILKKAIGAVWKSYSLYSAPIFLYHRATFLRMLGKKDEAIKLMSQFLSKQALFKSDQIDDSLLKWEGTDMAHAILIAQKWGQQEIAKWKNYEFSQ